MRPQDLFPTQDYADLWVGFYVRVLAEGPYCFEYTSYSGTRTLELSLRAPSASKTSSWPT